MICNPPKCIIKDLQSAQSTREQAEKGRKRIENPYSRNRRIANPTERNRTKIAKPTEQRGTK